MRIGSVGSRYISFGMLGAALVAGVWALFPRAQAADHADAGSLLVDTRLDINDVYFFQSPADATKTVLISTHNPVAGISSPLTFHPDLKYDFLIDNDGNAAPDIRFRFSFSAPDSTNLNKQTARLATRGLATNFVVTGSTSGAGSRNVDQTVNPAVSSTVNEVVTGNNVMFSAGVFDDPFFFDFINFRRGIRNGANPFGTAPVSDFFDGINVLAIVLEVPTDLIRGANNNIGVFSRVLLNGTQPDRNGRPVINGALIPGGAPRTTFNAGLPRNDVANFTASVRTSLLALGHTAESADALLVTDLPGGGRLLPDILTLDTAGTPGFPNGRRPQDDAIDVALNLVTSGRITTDLIDTNGPPDFPATFPYLARPNN